MGLASSFAAFVTRRQESPWEVVDSKSVEPVSIWDDEEGECSVYAEASRPLPDRSAESSHDRSQIWRSYIFMTLPSPEHMFSTSKKRKTSRTPSPSPSSSFCRRCTPRATMCCGMRGKARVDSLLVSLLTCAALQLAGDPIPEGQETSSRSSLLGQTCLSVIGQALIVTIPTISRRP